MKVPWNQKYLEELSLENENSSSMYSKKVNSQEKDIIELCKGLKNLGTQVDSFLEENTMHKLYCDNTTFYDIAIDNDRFCKFCLFKKVNLLIYDIII